MDRKGNRSGDSSGPVNREPKMAEPLHIEEEQFLPDLEMESPFLCSFCEDIQLDAVTDDEVQRELDMCRGCVRIDRSVRFSDYLLIQ